MTAINLFDVIEEIRHRIAYWEEMREHPGCGTSGKRSIGNRLSTLTDLLGWINKNA